MGLNKNITQGDNNSASAEMAYFLDVLTDFHSIISESQLTTAPQLTLIARSAESCIARAVYQFRNELKAANVNLRVIYNQVGFCDELSNWLLPDQSPLGSTPEANIRWARKASLADAHEQLTLMDGCSWSGESMRRDVNARFGFYLFNDDCQKTNQRAGNAFNAIWDISSPMPQTLFKRAGNGTPAEPFEFINQDYKEGQPQSIFLNPEFTRH